MAIIYTYPTKATPVDADLILISDSADSNKTKQVTVASIKGQTAGVTSVIAGTNVTISSTGASGTGDVTVNAAGGGTFSVKDNGGTAITGIDTLDFNTNLSVSHSSGSSTVTINASSGSSVDTFTNAFGTYITGTANSAATGAVTMGTIDLSATGTASNTTFLRGDNTWATPTSSGGISFNGTTANGIATYSNSTTANVSSAFTVSGNKLSAPAGALADPSIEVGAIGGLYAASGGILLAHNGANAIGVSSSSIINYKLTQFDSGLKFGSAGSTLSNYEFGTWTPTVYSPAGSWSGTASTGYYEVVGDMVRAYFKISTTNYPSNYPMNINNLPIAATTTAAYLGGVQVYTNTSSVQVGRATTGIITGANMVQFKTLQTSGNVNELIDSKYQPTGSTGTLEGLITYKKS